MKTNKTMRQAILPIIFCFFIGGFIPLKALLVFAEPPPEKTQANQVRIGWDEFKKLLKLDTDEIKLSWDEFKQLLTQTGSEVKVEYNIQNGMVVLKRDQFKQLLNNMKPPASTSVQPPSDYLITKAVYTGSMQQKSIKFKAKFNLEIFDKERTTYPKIRLLNQTAALHEIMLNNKPAPVMNEGGWYVLPINNVGQHVVELVFSVTSDLDKGPDILNLSIPQTAITLFSLDVPLKDVKIEIPQAKHITITTAQGHTKAEAVLTTTSQLQAKLHRTVAVKKIKGPSKIYSEAFNLISIEDDALRVSTKIKLNVLQNSISEIQAYVPKDYSILYVRNQNFEEIRSWQTKKDKKGRELLTVPFEGDKEGTVIFTITSERIFSKDENEIDFDGFQILDAVRETGYIGAEKKSTAETAVLKVENIDQIDIQELPLEMISMSQKPLIFGMRYLRHPILLTMSITKHEELATVNTVIDNASIMSVVLKEGKIITSAVYTIRNTWKQFLKLSLPKDTEIWSLYVNGSRELPSKDKEGKFMIPLVRSQINGETIAPFKVEIIYYEKSPDLPFFGGKKLRFPTADVVVSKMLWSCYLPVDYRYIYFGGNVDKESIATGIKPLVGHKRIYSSDNREQYSNVLNSWGDTSRKRMSANEENIRKQVISKFNDYNMADDSVQTEQQLEQEINFSSNLNKIQQDKLGRKGGADIAMLKINLPDSGQIFRFRKTVIEGEELFLDAYFIKEWVITCIKFCILLLAIYILIACRRIINKVYVECKEKVLSYKTFWKNINTPKGVCVISALGALVFVGCNKFLFTMFILLFFIGWLKPEWIFRGKKEVNNQQQEEPSQQG
ncbi:MAG: hypothetical protein ABII27_07395 [bacterium]